MARPSGQIPEASERKIPVEPATAGILAGVVVVVSLGIGSQDGRVPALAVGATGVLTLLLYVTTTATTTWQVHDGLLIRRSPLHTVRVDLAVLTRASSRKTGRGDRYLSISDGRHTIRLSQDQLRNHRALAHSLRGPLSHFGIDPFRL